MKQSKVIKLTIPRKYEEKKSIINSVIQKGHITTEIIGNLYSIPPNIVKVDVSDATITIKALKVGTTVINVSDRDGRKGRISVTVIKQSI